MGNRLSCPLVDLSGRVAIVTGGNNGIGYETAKALAVMGAHTIIACRSKERAEEAIDRMKAEVLRSGDDGKQMKLEYIHLDLSSLSSVKQFIVYFQERNLPLHMLINNAGVAWIPLEKTEDGFERQLQVNHLSHFLLTLELLPVLETTARETGDVRVVFVSSSAHSWATWEPDNMNGEKEYGRIKHYPKSKLYNVMTAHALQRRLSNVGITFSSLHPGVVNTNIVQGFRDVKALKFLADGFMWMSRSPKDGAATTINCAINPELNTQQCIYYVNCRPTTSSAQSRNESHQEELWKISIDMIKDFLSSSTLAKYGESPDVPTSQSTTEPETTEPETTEPETTEPETTEPETTDISEGTKE